MSDKPKNVKYWNIASDILLLIPSDKARKLEVSVTKRKYSATIHIKEKVSK